MARLMIVEDEFIVAKDIEVKLKKMGYDVIGIVTTGEEAVQQALAMKPDLILMDIKLDGEIDGIEATTQIHEHLDLPVIYVTAFADERTLQAAKLTEPFGYVLKPIETRELFVTIEIALYKYKTEKKLHRQLLRLDTIRQIDKAIISDRDLDKTLQRILELIADRMEVDAAAILLFNPKSQLFEYVAEVGIGQRLATFGNLSPEDLFAGEAVRSRNPVHIVNIQARNASPSTAWMETEGLVAYHAWPLISKAKLKGVLEVYHRSPLEFDEDNLEFLEALAAQTAIAVDNGSLVEELLSANAELIQAYTATIEGWSSALELRDLETEGHSQRVTEMTELLARAMGVEDKEALEHIRRGALLHDVGKMGIPDSILLKDGPLPPSEWETMRKHTEYAVQLLSPVKFLQPSLSIPAFHHERWDGSGYPHGLAGNEIPLSARIFAVVDVWDALLSDRPYRKGWPEEKVLEYIREQSGKQFDPEVVEAFFRIYHEAKLEISRATH